MKWLRHIVSAILVMDLVGMLATWIQIQNPANPADEAFRMFELLLAVAATAIGALIAILFFDIARTRRKIDELLKRITERRPHVGLPPDSPPGRVFTRAGPDPCRSTSLPANPEPRANSSAGCD